MQTPSTEYQQITK